MSDETKTQAGSSNGADSTRLHDELVGLRDRYRLLGDFLLTGEFHALELEEQRRLNAQYRHMGAYEVVLTERAIARGAVR